MPLFPPQQELLDTGFLESYDSWIICAPTGAGKTLMAEWAIERVLSHGKRAAYIAPLKAIVEEKRMDWSSKYARYGVGLFTGDTRTAGAQARPGTQQLLLLTPEKLASYVHSWKRHIEWLCQLDLLVVDEFHLLGDAIRGSSLEALLTRLPRINPFMRFVCITATLSNATEIASWLSARLFQSDWRPIPIEHRVLTFKRVADKIEFLTEEVDATVRSAGKVLVFVNSRRRSEQIAASLRDRGFRAAHHHAGLAQINRLRSRQELLSGSLDVVVTTSALEMGVNFPVRKVVLYDSFGFDGESFVPLSVQRYLQSAGRAGRMGYDDRGEAVLFLPVWARDKIDYTSAIPEPVRSGLFARKALQREILSELASRLSISEEHLEINFFRRTLWRGQGGKKNLHDEVQYLIDAGLIRLDKETGHYLSATQLGRLATQMSVSPGTMILASNVYRSFQNPTPFDLVFSACLAEETTPKLGFDFEEIDSMADLILSIPSRLLDRSYKEIRVIADGVTEKRVLAAVKMAVVLWEYVECGDAEVVAQNYDCYPVDISILAKNTSWILDTYGRAFACLHATEWKARHAEEEETKPPPCLAAQAAQIVGLMVSHAIPRDGLSLLSLPGIGGKRARKLLENGIRSTVEFREADSLKIAAILNVKTDHIKKIQSVAVNIPSYDANEEANIVTQTVDKVVGWTPSDVDPYRLRRALELRVEHASYDVLRVSGGAEPHTVNIETDFMKKRTYSCDCADYVKGTTRCKHIIRAQLELRDSPDLLEELGKLNDAGLRPLRLSLTELWMGISSMFDSYNDRSTDYSGRQFLEQVRRRSMRGSR